MRIILTQCRSTVCQTSFIWSMALLQINTLEMWNITEVLHSHMNAGRRYSGGVMEKLFDYAFDLYLHAPEFYSGPNGTNPWTGRSKRRNVCGNISPKDWTVQAGRIHMDKAIIGRAAAGIGK